jgi:hypothetical protein
LINTDGSKMMKRDKSGRFIKSKSKRGGKSATKPKKKRASFDLQKKFHKDWKKRHTGGQKFTKFQPQGILKQSEFNKLWEQHAKKFKLEHDDYNSSTTNFPNVQKIYSKDGRGLKPRDHFKAWLYVDH